MSDSTAVETVNQAIHEDPVPRMTTPAGGGVNLIRGIRQEDDEGNVIWHDVAVVRELTGADEEALATLEKKPGVTYSEYMNALLSRAVESIGDLPVNDAVINKLILGDRDVLFLEIVKATYGETREVPAICVECGTHNTVELELEKDFEVVKPDFDVREPIKVTFRKKDYFLRLPNGEDTIEAQKNTSNDAELNTVMLSRCAVFPDGDAPADTLAWARDLNVGLRRKLVNTLLEVKAGPDMGEVNTQCAECGAELPILLDWVSLLLS